MIERLFWRPLARFLARPALADRLTVYAMRTPYFHLPSDEDPSYMGRYWVFNPYDRKTNVPRWAPLIPFSIRVHHIKRADNERHMHDHPLERAHDYFARLVCGRARSVPGKARALLDHQPTHSTPRRHGAAWVRGIPSHCPGEPRRRVDPVYFLALAGRVGVPRRRGKSAVAGVPGYQIAPRLSPTARYVRAFY